MTTDTGNGSALKEKQPTSGVGKTLIEIRRQLREFMYPDHGSRFVGTMLLKLVESAMPTDLLAKIQMEEQIAAVAGGSQLVTDAEIEKAEEP